MTSSLPAWSPSPNDIPRPRHLVLAIAAARLARCFEKDMFQ
jgi:hypothetical protein